MGDREAAALSGSLRAFLEERGAAGAPAIEPPPAADDDGIEDAVIVDDDGKEIPNG